MFSSSSDPVPGLLPGESPTWPLDYNPADITASLEVVSEFPAPQHLDDINRIVQRWGQRDQRLPPESWFAGSLTGLSTLTGLSVPELLDRHSKDPKALTQLWNEKSDQSPVNCRLDGSDGSILRVTGLELATLLILLRDFLHGHGLSFYVEWQTYGLQIICAHPEQVYHQTRLELVPGVASKNDYLLLVSVWRQSRDRQNQASTLLRRQLREALAPSQGWEVGPAVTPRPFLPPAVPADLLALLPPSEPDTDPWAFQRKCLLGQLKSEHFEDQCIGWQKLMEAETFPHLNAELFTALLTSVTQFDTGGRLRFCAPGATALFYVLEQLLTREDSPLPEERVRELITDDQLTELLTQWAVELIKTPSPKSFESRPWLTTATRLWSLQMRSEVAWPRSQIRDLFPKTFRWETLHFPLLEEAGAELTRLVTSE